MGERKAQRGDGATRCVGAMRALVVAGALATLGSAGATSTPPSPSTATSPPPAACESCHAALGAKKVVHDGFSAASCTDCHAPEQKRGRCKSPVSSSWKLAAPAVELCAQCHAAAELTAKHAVKHAPVTAGRCAECHDAHSTDRPHLLRADGRKLCLRCHSASRPADLAKARVDRGKHAHSGFGDCADCHEIGHGGALPKLLQEAQPALCHRCHDAKDAAKVKHEAVVSGACTDCHAAHTSDAAKGLREAPAALCAGCHDADALAPRRVVHAPAVEGGCIGCHDPHGSANAKLLRAQGKAACLSCHAANAEGASAASPRMRVDLGKRHVHAALEGDCTDCHVQGHGADRDGMLRGETAALCYSCHDRLDAKPFVHSAARLGDCAVCHDPHSSDQPKLLAKPTIRATCFTCHDDDVVRRPVTHAPVADGDCTDCHSPHAAEGKGVLTAGSGKKTCYACHTVVDAGKVKHAPIRRYGCTICHDAHGAVGTFLLTKGINALCLDCHPRATPQHVTAMLPGGHPLEGGPDPRRIEREYGCTSCHDPHGSGSPRLFRAGETVMQACDSCHGNISGTNAGGQDLVGDRKVRRRRHLESLKGDGSAARDGPKDAPAQERPPLGARDAGGPDPARASVLR